MMLSEKNRHIYRFTVVECLIDKQRPYALLHKYNFIIHLTYYILHQL